jgi:hypothetical protein
LIQRAVQHSEIMLTGTKTFPGSTKFTYEKFEVSGCNVTVVARHDMWGRFPVGPSILSPFNLKNVDPAAMQVVGGAKSDVSLLKVQVTVPVTITTIGKKSGTTTESRSNIFGSEQEFDEVVISRRFGEDDEFGSCGSHLLSLQQQGNAGFCNRARVALMT